MSFETALRDELTGISGLNGRVFPLTTPEGTKPPYVTFASSEGLPDKTLSSFLSSKHVPCEINVVGARYDDMKTLAADVIAKIQSFQGRVIGTDGPFIQEVAYDEPFELYEQHVEWYRTNISVRFYF